MSGMGADTLSGPRVGLNLVQFSHGSMFESKSPGICRLSVLTVAAVQYSTFQLAGGENLSLSVFILPQAMGEVF